MKSYQFAVETHPEYRNIGYTPLWYPNGDPYGGMTVAHDIMEHFPNDDGSAEGEFLALGCTIWLRGDSGYMQRKGNHSSTIDNIAAEFPEIWRAHTQNHERDSIIPCELVDDDEAMEMCREIVKEGNAYIDEFSNESWNKEDSEYIARYLASGYKRAQDIYPDNYTAAFCLFKSIEEEADRLLNFAECGQILTVMVDIKRFTAQVELQYPEDDY